MRRSAQTRGPSGWVEPRAGGGGGRGGAQALRRRRRPGTARRGRGRRCLRVPGPPPASPSPRLLAGGWSAPGPGRGPPINPDLVARASPGSRSREERQRGEKFLDCSGGSFLVSQRRRNWRRSRPRTGWGWGSRAPPLSPARPHGRHPPGPRSRGGRRSPGARAGSRSSNAP